MASEKTTYTKINTADNMRVVDSMDLATNPKEFVCLLDTERTGGQMDLQLNAMVKMYLNQPESD